MYSPRYQTKHAPTSRLASIECLLDNIVEDDIQNLLYPLNLMLKIFYSPKYTIRDNYITPNSTFVNILSFLVTATGIILSTYHILFDASVDTVGVVSSYIAFLSSLFFVVFYNSGAMAIFVLNMAYTDKNILFVLTIQKIHKALDMNMSIRSVVVWYWLSFALVLCVNASFVLRHHDARGSLCSVYVLIDLLLITFDINLMYALHLLNLLRSYLKEWNKKMSSLSEQQRDDKYCENLFDVYQHILHAYVLHNQIFQGLMLFSTLDTCARIITYVEVMIQAFKRMKNDKNANFEIFAAYAILWMLKTMFAHVYICTQYEKIYQTFEDAKSACIIRLSNIHRPASDDERRLCKKVLQASRGGRHKLSACGLFHVDAALLLSVTGLLTNYTVVLLQFAFL